MSASGAMLRHAVDALPNRVVRWQARRAALLNRVAPLDPFALPASLPLTPGLDHAVYARRAAIVSSVLGVLAVFMLRDESVLLEFRLLACLPLAVCLWLTVDFLQLARTLPTRLTLRLLPDGLEIETERGMERRPYGSFAGVAIRSWLLSRGLPERHLRRRTLAQMRDRVWERRTLHWVELTDADPKRSVPLWALEAHDAFDRAKVLRAAHGFATALGVPLISTGGIDPVEVARADALPGLAAAPPIIRAAAAREAVHPQAVVREAMRPAPRAPSAPSRPEGSTAFAAGLYAMAMLVVGGLAWIIRVAGFEGTYSPVAAIALEMLPMIGLCAALAGVIRLAANVPPRLSLRLWMGGVALAVLLVAEVLVSSLLLDESVAATLAAYGTPHGLLRLAGQAVAAMLPALFLLLGAQDGEG